MTRFLALALAALALAALALAGCLTPGEIRDRVRDSLQGEGPRFGPEIAMEQESMGAEPNMAILPDGTIFVTAVAGGQERPNALEGAAWLWRSRDGGESWETIRAPMRETPLGTSQTRRPFASSDADVAASGDGWIYYSDWWNWGAPASTAGTGVPNLLPRAGNYLVERSSDGGRTWANTSVTGPDTMNIDRQWLVAGDNGFVGLAYNWYNDPRSLASTPLGPGGSELRIVTSRDHGVSWTLPVAVAPVGPDVGYIIAKPFLLPSADGNATGIGGTILFPFIEIPWSGNFSTPGTVKVAHSKDGGNWTTSVIAENVLWRTIWPLQGAAWGAGQATLAWNEEDGDGVSLVVSHLESIREDASTWSAPDRVVRGGTNVLPWVAGAPDGRLAIGAYFSNATGPWADHANETEWRFGVWESATPRDNATWRLVFASEVVKTGRLCPEGAACPSDRELLDYVALAYGPDDRLHAAWSRSRENPEVAGALIGHVHYAGSLA